MVAFNSLPDITFWVAPNQYSALTYPEFLAVGTGAMLDSGSGGDATTGTNSGRKLAQGGAPASVDWQAQGKVTAAKDQAGVRAARASLCLSFAVVRRAG